MEKLAFIFLLFGLMSVSACSDIMTWQEEVKFNDGRTILVNQKRRCEGGYTGGNIASCIERETWLTVKLLDFGNWEIVWHENLSPMVLNIHNGKLYVVGTPPTGREFSQYGKPQPPYIGFRLESGRWQRIPFSEIPEEVYDTNLILDGFLVKATLLKLTEKRKINSDPSYPKPFKRIDPNYHSKFN